MINLVDILMGCLVVQGIASGRRNGIVVEFFRTIGIFCVTFISLHYYRSISVLIGEYLFFPETNRDFGIFFGLSTVISFLFFLMQGGWAYIIKIKFSPVFEEWGGTILACLRTYLLCGLVFFSFLICDFSFVSAGAHTALTGWAFRNTSAKIYGFCFVSFISKIAPDEKINSAVFAALEKPAKKKKFLSVPAS